MLADKLEKLKQGAEAATPGGWASDNQYITGPEPWPGARPDEVIFSLRRDHHHTLAPEQHLLNAQHVVNMDPATALALLRIIELQGTALLNASTGINRAGVAWARQMHGGGMLNALPYDEALEKYNNSRDEYRDSVRDAIADTKRILDELEVANG